ncbi:alanine dehydrogenase [Neobacillus thermocopriae]|uniref:Alanine dehydrogenase n=1 Tax=Neobacillus thermocopriae TaxID=1215031 RepID=A0A6B3TPY0_9BACI|nr:alanine dehydrogenase [Neobacillus thermocopriae]MED3622735.1 alanine dehydrogenase [Neobacillus thermocopriae]MED3714171.1 alanine dehydrogenase [Neobacillus thermocopriae]NEX78456.1 alanine dehydrogenase [Neobacillus thermocopriae]
MRIGVPKEIKNNENRVAMTPAGVVNLVQFGHEVFVEKSAGLGSGFTDEDYQAAGAKLVNSAEEAWSMDMVMKVKEPLPEEYKYFREGLILFTYLHLAPEPELTKALIEKKVVGIAYETVQLPNGTLPLLTPMSEVAGRMATQVGAQFLEKINGGMGILLSGVPGVQRGKVTIIGGGVAGTNAAKMAIGLGAKVTIIDLNPERLRQLDDIFGSEVTTLMSNPYNIAEAVKDSDLVIGAVLIPGAKAPKLVTEEMVKSMKKGSVVVDIAIDQGGIFETTDRITTHSDPTYVKHGVVHYAVANMPGAVPRTSTFALTNVTVPYALQIANKGYRQACLDNEALLKGINTLNGYVTYKAVADAHGLEYRDARELLG